MESSGARRPTRGDHVPVAAALGVLAALVAVDVWLGERVVLVSAYIAAPLLCGLTTSPRITRRVAALTLVAALASFAWNRSFEDWGYWVPLGVVTMGGAFASLMATYRERVARDARRLQVLADVAAVAYGDHELTALAQALADLLVPRLADLCVVDVVGADGEVHRVAGALEGDPELLEAVLRRAPDLTLGRGGLTGATRHEPAIDDNALRRLAHDDDDLGLLRRLGLESAVLIPLLARLQPVGALTLATCAPRPRIGADEVEFLETLAGRVALALDNAMLAQELVSARRQLEAILGTVDAGIVVRAADGPLIYANQAAADLLKLPDPDAVRAYPPGRLMERFDVYTEDGDPVALGDLPGTRLLAGEPAPPSMLVRNVVKETGEERWLLNRATAVTDAQGRIAMAVNLIADVTETKRGEIAQRLLAGTARAVTGAADLATTLQAIADAAVPGLADWASVDLVDPAGRVAPVALAHRDPEKVRLGRLLRERWPPDPRAATGVPAVVRTAVPQLVREVSDEMLVRGARDPEQLALLRAIGLTSIMIAPIRAGDRVLGALSYASATSRRFDERDLELACDLASQAGVFISNAQLHAEQAHIAHTLQAGLIPESLPRLEGWTVSSVYRAAGRANEVGGDFYDVVPCGPGWAAIIGDVVGKGAEAAALTALARHTLAAIIESTGDAGHALNVLNRRLLERGADFSSLCTIAVVTVTRGGRAAILSAGHPPPLLLHRGVAEFVGRAGPMLGMLERVTIPRVEVDVAPGDQLVLYTDGVIDAVGVGDRFGETRLRRAVAGMAGDAPDSPAEHLLSVVDDFLAGDQNDDIAIVSLVRSAVAAAPAAA